MFLPAKVQKNELAMLFTKGFDVFVVKQCPHLTAPVHGYIRGTNNRHPNSVHFGCDFGYIISNGSSKLTCGHTGQWNGMKPQCISKI